MFNPPSKPDNSFVHTSFLILRILSMQDTWNEPIWYPRAIMVRGMDPVPGSARYPHLLPDGVEFSPYFSELSACVTAQLCIKHQTALHQTSNPINYHLIIRTGWVLKRDLFHALSHTWIPHLFKLFRLPIKIKLNGLNLLWDHHSPLFYSSIKFLSLSKSFRLPIKIKTTSQTGLKPR